MGSKYRRPVGKKVSEAESGALNEKVIYINRVAKVVKGGRRFSFSALVVVGDGKGVVGYGLGKANEVPEAIRKGGEAARKGLIRVPLTGATLPFEVIGASGAGKVLLRPASPGTGVIAGSTVRSVMELMGVHDVLSKSFRSQNPHNVLAAVFDALLQLEDPAAVAARRGKALDELEYQSWSDAGQAVSNQTVSSQTGSSSPVEQSNA
jgi:small subunit ribosomal protein S5